jgi:hypothetical protein
MEMMMERDIEDGVQHNLIINDRVGYLSVPQKLDSPEPELQG